MRHVTRVIAHNLGDITAAFLFPIFCAVADAMWGAPQRGSTTE